METDDNWPVYHGMIKSDLAEARVRQDNRVGSYLVRYAGGDYILTYLQEGLNIKHIKLSNALDTNLRKCHPGLDTMRKTVSFLTGLKMHFLYEVPCTEFGEPEENSSYRRDGLTCHICDKVFREKAELCLHVRCHKVAFCEYCSDIVPTSNFASHRQRCLVQANVTQTFTCDICHVFETPYKKCLKRHKETLHGDNSVQCTVCDKRFRNSIRLQAHMTSHQGFPCQHCGKRFKSNYHKNRHVANAHEPDSPSRSVSQSTDCHPSAPSPLPPCPATPCRTSPPSPLHLNLLTSTPCHSEVPPPNFPSNEDPVDSMRGANPADQHHSCTSKNDDVTASPDDDGDDGTVGGGGDDDNDGDDDGNDDSEDSGDEDELEPGEHESNRQQQYSCTKCKYKGRSKKRLRRHEKMRHSDRPAPVIECDFCPEFKTIYPKSYIRHLKNSCPGLKDFCMLDAESLWEVLTEINISNNQAYKFLSLLAKKMGVRFFPKYLRKVLSEKLNSYRQYLTVENLFFTNKEGNCCHTSSTLVYCKSLKKAIDDAIEGRGVVRPHINIGVDGGGKAVIVIAQIYDLDELDSVDDDDDENKKELVKSLGAKRSIVLARGDFAYESRDNIELIYSKLKMFETMQNYESWHQVGDCKVQNACAGMNFILAQSLIFIFLFVVRGVTMLLGELGNNMVRGSDQAPGGDGE